MKKVVMLLTNPYRPDPRVEKEAKTLVGAGYEVTVFAWDRTREYPPVEERGGVHIIRAGPRSAFSNFMVFAVTLPFFWLKALFFLLKNRWDIVHCNDLDTLLPGVLAARLLGRKVVYDAHEIYSAMIEEDVPRPVFRLVYMFERWMVKKPDRVICVNERFAEILSGWGALDPVPVMGCNPVQEVPHEKVEELRSRLGLKNKKVVLYIGVLEPTRKLVEFVEGFSQRGWDDVVFVIGGFGSLAGRIKKAAEKSSGTVIFVGEVHPDEVPVYTHMADVLVAVYDPRYGNNRDSVPNKLFEAMSAGKPIVVAKGTWTGKTVEKIGCGMAVDYYGDEVFDAIRRLLDDPSLYKQLSERARKAFLEKYNWDVMAKRLLGVYESCL